MTEYLVKLIGCDDGTAMVMNLAPHELATVRKLARWSQAFSTCGCQPALYVQAVADLPADDYEVAEARSRADEIAAIGTDEP